MGLADLPRATFSGFTHWNPSTMNNNDAQPTYDPASASLNWPWLERHGLQGEADFDRYATNPIPPAPNDRMLGEFFDPTCPPAEWNFYGDMACGFVQPDVPAIEWPEKFSKPAGGTTINGFTDPSGTRVSTGDPWIGQPVQINDGLTAARLVDVDPVAAWSTQIFHDTFSIGSQASGVGVVGRTAGRAHSRWVFFRRNFNQNNDVLIAGIASAMFQIALPSAGLTFFGASQPGSLGSLFQQALGAKGVRGLMVRFVTYHTVYFQGAAFPASPTQPPWGAIVALYQEYATALAKYQRGELAMPPPMPVNRSYSNVVGWIAPWTASDMRTAPVGRILHAPTTGIQPNPPLPKPTSLGPAAVEYAVDPARPTEVSRITLDLGSTIPEVDGTLAKADFGTLELGLRASPGGTVKPVALVAYTGGYDAASYVANGGVVDIPASAFLRPVTTADLKNQLVVRFVSDASKTQLGLEEADYSAQTDDRAVYLDEPGAPWSPGDQAITVDVRYRGGPPPAGTTLRVAQYAPAPPGFIEFGWQLVSEAPTTTSGPNAQAPYVALSVGGQPAGSVSVAVPVSVGPGATSGIAEFSVSPLRSGPPVLQFTVLPVGELQPPDADVDFFVTAQAFFANVRVLPFYNDMAVAYDNWLRTGPSVDLVTQRAFDTVFKTYYLMYPVMRFLGDPLQFQANRGRILQSTDPALFESPAYMPMTRSLAAGQRQVLALWSTYLDGTVVTPVLDGGRIGRRG